MIALISGTVVHKQPDMAVVQTGGVGYRVFITLNTFYELPPVGGEVSLHIHTVVREDAINLYGFTQPEEKQTFNKLISISGVGPKVALGMLSGIAPVELWRAVRARDAERLTKIPGIGKKTAARLVVELEGKLPQALDGEALPDNPLLTDVLSALVNLGYPEAAARKALDKIAVDENAGLQEVLKAALQSLAGGK